MAFTRVFSWLVLILYSPTLSTSLTLHPSPTQHNNSTQLERRGGPSPTELSTCGYLDGDPKKIRTADSGYNCRIDTSNGLWGFCPTTVITATDCGLAAACIDDWACSAGCGYMAKPKLTTFTCSSEQFCSAALLTFGVDQTYSYIACGDIPTTEHYLLEPMEASTTVESTSSKTSPTPAPTTSNEESKPTTDISVELSQTSSEPVPSETAAENDEKPMNLASIIGGAIGGLALVCASAIVIIYIMRRHRASPAVDSRQVDEPAEPPVYNHPKLNTHEHWIPQELPASARKVPQFYELAS